MTDAQFGLMIAAPVIIGFALMLYRMGRDVHAQLPPDRLSVSLNILGYPAGQRWRDQYRFDTARNRIAETLTVASSEVLLESYILKDDAVGLRYWQWLERHLSVFLSHPRSASPGYLYSRSVGPSTASLLPVRTHLHVGR